jgi:hypothetical protein
VDRARLLIAAIALGLATVSAGPGQVGGPPGSRADAGVLSGSLHWYEGALTPGSPATLGLVLTVEDGWHVQAGRGSGDEIEPYVATEVVLELPEGWTAGVPLWSPADSFRFGEGEFAEDLRGYAGTFVVALPVQVPAEADDGVQAFGVRIDYQACDDSVCLAPQTIVLEGTTEASVVDGEIARLFERTLSRAPARAPPAPGPRELDVSTSKWWGSLAFVWAACLWMVHRTIRIARRPVPLLATGLGAIALMWAMLAFTRAITAPRGSTGSSTTTRPSRRCGRKGSRSWSTSPRTGARTASSTSGC